MIPSMKLSHLILPVLVLGLTAPSLPALGSDASRAAAEGHKAYKDKKYRDAASHFSMAITFDGTHAEYYYWASMSHSAAMEDAEAYEWILGALSLDRSDPKIHAQHGRACLFMGNPGEAALAYEKALEMDPSSGRIWADYATVLKQSGHPYQAMEALQKAHGLDPGIPGLVLDLGLVLMEMGDPEEAVTPLRRAVADDPRCHGCQLALADALLASHDPRAALDAYGAALRLVPDDYRAVQRSIQCCYALADYDAARGHRRALQALYEDDKVYALGDRQGYVIDRFEVRDLAVQVYEYFDGEGPEGVQWSFVAYDPTGWREKELAARFPAGQDGRKKKQQAAMELVDVTGSGESAALTTWQQTPSYPSVKTAVIELLKK